MKAIFSDQFGIEGVNFGPRDGNRIPWVQQVDSDFHSGVDDFECLMDALANDEVVDFRPTHVTKSREDA